MKEFICSLTSNLEAKQLFALTYLWQTLGAQQIGLKRKMGKIYQVVVHGLRGQKMMLDLCNTEEQFKSMTVKQLKEKLAQKLPETAGKTADRKQCMYAFMLLINSKAYFNPKVKTQQLEVKVRKWR